MLKAYDPPVVDCIHILDADDTHLLFILLLLLPDDDDFFWVLF